MAMVLNSENFEKEVLKSEIPVLVDFWADWCGPCRMLAPVIEELSKEYKGRIKVCKLNVDDAQDIAAGYGIMSIPTIILFNNGKIAKQTVGVVPKEQLTEMFSTFIK